MTITWPTVLTLGRLAAAPAIGLAFLVVARPLADWIALILFLGAAATDWLDGLLARRTGQVTRLGTMLDPIADKAMVVIALAVLVGLFGLTGWILVPALVILFREVFVSGLREFLGDVAGTLAVTKLAKWKTAVQMVAIATLLIHGVFAHHLGMMVFAMDETLVIRVLQGAEEDRHGLGLLHLGSETSWILGLALLWVAAALTAATGWDYFAKARPHLTEEPRT